MKNSNATIGNRTRGIPTCSAVPQPTALPRAPFNIMVRAIYSNQCAVDGDNIKRRCTTQQDRCVPVFQQSRSIDPCSQFGVVTLDRGAWPRGPSLPRAGTGHRYQAHKSTQIL